MTPGFTRKTLALLVFVGSALSLSLEPVRAQAAAPAEEASSVVVYLVRHAEKAEDGTDDPPLSVAGQIRVQTLKAILADANLSHVHSTDLERTRETARPIAEEAGLDVGLYDPTDLQAFADRIRLTPGNHLVSGHSDTTPELVAALGGDPRGTIHDLEYDRLYIVVIAPAGEIVTTLLRFGEPYVAGQDFGLRNSTARTPPWSPPGRPPGR